MDENILLPDNNVVEGVISDECLNVSVAGSSDPYNIACLYNESTDLSFERFSNVRKSPTGFPRIYRSVRSLFSDSSSNSGNRFEGFKQSIRSLFSSSNDGTPVYDFEGFKFSPTANPKPNLPKRTVSFSNKILKLYYTPPPKTPVFSGAITRSRARKLAIKGRCWKLIKDEHLHSEKVGLNHRRKRLIPS